MLIFALELDRRSRAGGWGIVSNAAHPGWAASDLIDNGMGGGFRVRLVKLIWPLLAQSGAAGALPTLYAATAPGGGRRRLLRAAGQGRAQGTARPGADERRSAGRRRGTAALGGSGAADRRPDRLMHLESEAIVVAVRAHGEHGAIVRALTPRDGIQAGYVRGGRSRRLRPVLAAGNRIQAEYRARTEEQLAQLTVELAHSRALLYSEPLAAAGIEWVCALTAAASAGGAALSGAL